MNVTRKLTIVFVLLAIYAINVFGSDASSQEAGGRHQEPPPEAYSACEGKSAGDTAQFVGPRGETVTGRCEQEGERLVLRGETVTGNNFSFSGNGDGTVTDNVPGLMWQQNPDTDGGGIDADDKLFPDRAGRRASTLKLNGYTDWLFPTDWLLPTIKKLDLRMDFWGIDPSGYDGSDTANEGGSSDSVDSSDGDGNFVDASGYAVVDTGQIVCYDDSDEVFNCPAAQEPFYGQDAQFDSHQPGYTGNGDGTVTDHVTRLMWQQSPDTDGDGDIDADDKLSYDEAVARESTLNLGGYTDWRLPTIKELYSLIDFSGLDPSGYKGTDTSGLIPFIDTAYFDFAYGDTSAGERIIDAQYASSTLYVSNTAKDDGTVGDGDIHRPPPEAYTACEGKSVGDTAQFVSPRGETVTGRCEQEGERLVLRGETVPGNNSRFTDNGGGRKLFGVNFADGRIKGYGLSLFGSDKTFFVIYVRDNIVYGQNDLADNGDGTITDYATDLMWSQDDSGEGLNWEAALAWVEQKNAENHLGYSDWRLPNAKELQSIVDYTRSPDTTGSAAIDPLFNVTTITNEALEEDYPYYWSSTTHANWTASSGSYGAYVAFGRAMGFMDGTWVDVHGAGAQRSDPKAGDANAFPTGHGPQGDAIRIYNYVRLVRDA